MTPTAHLSIMLFNWKKGGENEDSLNFLCGKINYRFKSINRFSTYISVTKSTSSKLITSGAANSGVPNITCNPLLNCRAKPKSINFIRLPVRVTHNTFSGLKNDNNF